MSQEISIEHEGVNYKAEYEVFEDTLVVYLPDNTTRETELRGLKPESAAKVHLRGYIKQNT